MNRKYSLFPIRVKALQPPGLFCFLPKRATLPIFGIVVYSFLIVVEVLQIMLKMEEVKWVERVEKKELVWNLNLNLFLSFFPL